MLVTIFAMFPLRLRHGLISVMITVQLILCSAPMLLDRYCIFGSWNRGSVSVSSFSEDTFRGLFLKSDRFVIKRSSMQVLIVKDRPTDSLEVSFLGCLFISLM